MTYNVLVNRDTRIGVLWQILPQVENREKTRQLYSVRLNGGMQGTLWQGSQF